MWRRIQTSKSGFRPLHEEESDNESDPEFEMRVFQDYTSPGVSDINLGGPSGEQSASHESSFDDMISLNNLFDETSLTTEQQTTVPQSIEEDIPILREFGFDIDYPDGKLGEGYSASVYRGIYGLGAPHEGPNAVPALFAVKIAELPEGDDEDTIDTRAAFETEKYILTTVKHKNCVSIRMIINMGEVRAFSFTDDPSVTFLSPQRIYMIMDYADAGVMEDWLLKNSANMKVWQRIDFIRGLFNGMLYLHRKEIAHGDAHLGNVLLFTEGGELVPKWTDFGIGFVGRNREYRFKRNVESFIDIKMSMDISSMGNCFSTIMKNRLRLETQEEQNIIEQFSEMIEQMRDDNYTSLEQVLDQYRHLLEGELLLD